LLVQIVHRIAHEFTRPGNKRQQQILH